MSRWSLRQLLCFAASPALLTSTLNAPARSQATAESVIKDADAAFGPRPPRAKCEPNDRGEIVVCAEEQEQSQFRVKSSNQLDSTSHEALDDGLPRAPDFAPPPCRPSLLTLCPKLGAAPEPHLILDVSALPEAPPGSDADNVGKRAYPES